MLMELADEILCSIIGILRYGLGLQQVEIAAMND